ncbi:hypothetical protein [Falsibacillus pallidus]|uniref:Uncharacterized protein n=1 Tax=Falsibacillus pallidus TaxID=493781 RepID=A0A370GAG2_9BACI|nr:hypothetical protein [Falsibacillus pallidus]RDI40166.1 hypothetical protein DFR59_11282 [Falsibacillus pallidus]
MKRFKKNRLWPLGAAVLCALLLVCFFIVKIIENKEAPPLPIYDGLKLNISSPDAHYIKIDEKQKKYDSITDHQFLYSIKRSGKQIGYLSITKRTLPNHDVVFFEKMRLLSGTNYAVAKLNITPEDSMTVAFNDWNKEKKVVEHHEDFGEDPTTNPDGLYKMKGKEKQFEFVLGNSFRSREMVKSYNKDQKSKIRELIAEDHPTGKDQGKISITLKGNADEITESWFVISKDKLFKNEDTEKDWVSFSLHNPTKTNNWLTENGPINKLPWSIEPFTKMGYGRNLGRFQDRESLDRYQSTHERLFYDLTLNSYADLKKYQQEKGTDHWETEYTSTWLKKAYGIKAPYVDTRHNEYISLFLSDVRKTFKLGDPNAPILGYANYLLSQIKKDNTIKVGDSYLIRDYYSPYSKEENHTHSSLNHELGGLNMLLHAYEASNDTKYLAGAKTILNGIESLGDQWIRDNGDLWYQVNSDLTFSGGDYEQLTLIDLLNTQGNLYDVGLKPSAVLQELIDAKVAYLQSEDIELLPEVAILIDENGKNAAFS